MGSFGRVSVFLENSRSWVHRWRNGYHSCLESVDRGFIGGVMASVLFSKGVDRGFICGMMVNVFVSKAVDHGFIAGIMVNVLIL